MTFSATGRSNFSWMARYTFAMPPLPSADWIRYPGIFIVIFFVMRRPDYRGLGSVETIGLSVDGGLTACRTRLRSWRVPRRGPWRAWLRDGASGDPAAGRTPPWSAASSDQWA